MANCLRHGADVQPVIAKDVVPPLALGGLRLRQSFLSAHYSTSFPARMRGAVSIPRNQHFR